MESNRRQFIMLGAGVALSRIAGAQEQREPYFLEFPAAKVNVAGDYTCAAFVNADCILRIELDLFHDRVLAKGDEVHLGTREAAPVLDWKVAAAGERLLSVGATVRPTGSERVHLAGVLRPNTAEFRPVSTAPDRKRLSEIAAQAAFVRDPAPRGQPGHFVVHVDTVCDLHLEIWRDHDRRRLPVFDRDFRQLAPGDNPIPWQLRDHAGRPVDPGDYLATLTAIPHDHKISDTLFFSSFAVV